VRPAPDGDAPDPVAALAEPVESGPEARALAGELERRLDAALDELPPEWRDAVVLRDIEGLSTHDAAEVVGVGEAAFKSQLHRGRMQLRALLEPYLGLGEG
jgi:RNA polymerase sigma-70 factor (ECF subfamily)